MPIIKNSCENWNLFLRNTWDNLAVLVPQLLARNTKGLRSNIHVMGLFHVFYRQIHTYSQNVDICLSFKETVSGNLGTEFQTLFHMGFLCCLGAQKIKQYKMSQKWGTSDWMPSIKVLLAVLAGSYMVSWWLPAVKLINSSCQSSHSQVTVSVLNQGGLLRRPLCQK